MKLPGGVPGGYPGAEYPVGGYPEAAGGTEPCWGGTGCPHAGDTAGDPPGGAAGGTESCRGGTGCPHAGDTAGDTVGDAAGGVNDGAVAAAGAGAAHSVGAGPPPDAGGPAGPCGWPAAAHAGAG